MFISLFGDMPVDETESEKNLRLAHEAEEEATRLRRENERISREAAEGNQKISEDFLGSYSGFNNLMAGPGETKKERVDLSWVTSVKDERSFELWSETFLEKCNLYLKEQISDENKLEDFKYLCLLLAAEKGDFVRMIREARRLRSLGTSCEEIIVKLKRLFGMHKSQQREISKLKFYKLRRKHKFSLFQSLVYLDSILDECSYQEFHPTDEEKIEAIKRLCSEAEWSQVHFFAAIMNVKGSEEPSDADIYATNNGLATLNYKVVKMLAFKVADNTEMFLKNKHRDEYAYAAKSNKYKKFNKNFGGQGQNKKFKNFTYAKKGPNTSGHTNSGHTNSGQSNYGQSNNSNSNYSYSNTKKYTNNSTHKGHAAQSSQKVSGPGGVSSMSGTKDKVVASGEKSGPVCWICNKVGHISKDCRQKNGSSFVKRQLNTQQ